MTANTAPIQHMTQQPAKEALGAQAKIPPRRMDFEFKSEESPRYFYGNDPFLSIFWQNFSALLPEGEAFFVEAVRHYRSQITDPLLKAQVSGFIGQEAMHAKEHDAFNKMIATKGLPLDKVDSDLHTILTTVFKYLPKSMSLAATVCLEHYTAIMAEQLLRDPEHQGMMNDQQVLAMWLWHALEENEHKAVAFDVLEQVNGSYLLRAGTMIPTTILLFAIGGAFNLRLLAADGQLFKVRQNLRGLNFLFGYKGLFPKLVPQFFDFFKPGFHPNDHDTSALLEEWREKLFGANGMLKDQIKKPGNQKPH
jgi:predicted metal-dependent hydrolase